MYAFREYVGVSEGPRGGGRLGAVGGWRTRGFVGQVYGFAIEWSVRMYGCFVYFVEVV